MIKQINSFVFVVNIILLNPILPSVPTYGQNLDFKIKRDNVKHSYEGRAYKSVDNRSYISEIGRK